MAAGHRRAAATGRPGFECSISLFILDTDTLSLYERGHEEVCRRVKDHPQEELAITVISVEEQLTGWYTLLRRAKRPRELARAYQRLTDNVQFLAQLQILPFGQAAITRYDELRALKLNVGKMDLRIAAIALESRATIVTRNVDDFQRVPGLNIEDWTR